jgi:Amt family ammonium transporter
VATNTTLAACAAGLTALSYTYVISKKWDISFTVNGFLAGLVAITCPCYWVSPTGSILLGGIAGVLVVLGVEVLEWLRIDDPIGAVPVHGFCGIWGTLSLGLFACGRYGATGAAGADNSVPLTGLFYGGGLTVLKAQLIGSLIVTSATRVALAVMYSVKAMDCFGSRQKVRRMVSICMSTGFQLIRSVIPSGRQAQRRCQRRQLPGYGPGRSAEDQ